MRRREQSMRTHMDEVGRRLAIQEENRQQKLAWLLYHRQQSLVDGYAERFEQAVLKLFEFVGNGSKQLDLSRLSEPDRKRSRTRLRSSPRPAPSSCAAPLTSAAPIRCSAFERRCTPALFPPPTPPPAAPLPIEEEPVQHLPYNDHAVNMQIVRPSSPTPAADPTPSVPQPPRAPLADPQPPAESSRPSHSRLTPAGARRRGRTMTCRKAFDVSCVHCPSRQVRGRGAHRPQEAAAVAPP